MGSGVDIPWVVGSIYHVNIPWVGVRYNKGRGFDIPWAEGVDIP